MDWAKFNATCEHMWGELYERTSGHPLESIEVLAVLCGNLILTMPGSAEDMLFDRITRIVEQARERMHANAEAASKPPDAGDPSGADHAAR